MPSPTIQAMVKRCILEQPLMQWCMAFSACVDFTHPPKQLLEIVLPSGAVLDGLVELQVV